MSKKPSVDQLLLLALRASGPQSPASLMSRLEVSQPTLFRAAKKASQKVIALGGRRNRKLCASRSIGELGNSLPVFMVSPEGDIKSAGQILALHPSTYAFVLEAAPSMPRLYAGLPSFLRDVCPRGFFGTAFAKIHSDLGFPPDLKSWSNDQFLEAISRRGEDLYGNVLIGAESLERFQAPRAEETNLVDTENPGPAYLALAEAAEKGDPQGSGVGGEQPKFCAAITDGRRDEKKVIVKFSPKGDSFSAKRWRDLLLCESIALATLNDAGINAADTRIIEHGGRVFLESTRFDRVGLRGRKRVLSLAALEASWSEKKTHWAQLGGMLAQEKKIFPDDLDVIKKLEAFGRMIANSDRGPDNLSFLWNPGDARATLAPIYDMLPMLYAPDAKGADSGALFSMPTYDSSLLSTWREAKELAIVYWEAVMGDARISPAFRAIAEANKNILNA